MTLIQHRSRWAIAGLLAGAMLVAGCDVKEELLAPQQPGVLGPGDIASAGAAGAEALRVGAEGGLQQMVGGGNVNTENLWMMSDLLTDVWKSGDTFLERNETDQRAIQSSNSVWSSVYLMAHRARGYARDAAAALAKAIPDQPGEQAEMWFIMGFAEMNLSQDFCNGVPFSITQAGLPQYQAGVTNQAGFNVAITHFDSALALAGGTDSVAPRIKTASLIAKAEALVDLGQFAAAAALVPTSAVPTSYQYATTYSQPTTSNEIWSLNASQSSARYVVGDSFDLKGRINNALPFASAKDPRVPVEFPNQKTFDGFTPLVDQLIWVQRSDPIPVATGVDARLIEAEAKLNLKTPQGIADMMTILNALRGAPQTLGPLKVPAMAALPIPATQDAAVNLFFREKAFWQFGRGNRLGDMRRLIRQYGRTQDTVFPIGKFHKPGGASYGTDVNLPVTDNEKTNPNFTGCIDRNA